MDFDQQELANRPFILEDVVVKPLTNELVIGQTSITIEDKVMKVLVYLVMNRSRIVSREELFTNLWPDVYVSQDSLNRCISIVRKFWNENGSQAQVIVTVRNRGYRITGTVKPFSEKESTTIRSRNRLLQKAKYVASGVAITIGMISLFIIFTCLV